MAEISVYKKYCIFREFLEDETFLIIIYNNENKKFYQTIVTDANWATMMPNYTLNELEKIFQICFKGMPNYSMTIENSGDGVLVVNFDCREMIKTYRWSFYLNEKVTHEFDQLTKVFDDVVLKCNLDEYTTSLFRKVEADVKTLFCNSRRELQMIPYIHMIENETTKRPEKCAQLIQSEFKKQSAKYDSSSDDNGPSTGPTLAVGRTLPKFKGKRTSSKSKLDDSEDNTDSYTSDDDPISDEEPIIKNKVKSRFSKNKSKF